MWLFFSLCYLEGNEYIMKIIAAIHLCVCVCVNNHGLVSVSICVKFDKSDLYERKVYFRLISFIIILN